LRPGVVRLPNFFFSEAVAGGVQRGIGLLVGSLLSDWQFFEPTDFEESQ
jgi:hypothetical protein